MQYYDGSYWRAYVAVADPWDPALENDVVFRLVGFDSSSEVEVSSHELDGLSIADVGAIVTLDPDDPDALAVYALPLDAVDEIAARWRLRDLPASNVDYFLYHEEGRIHRMPRK